MPPEFGPGFARSKGGQAVALAALNEQNNPEKFELKINNPLLNILEVFHGLLDRVVARLVDDSFVCCRWHGCLLIIFGMKIRGTVNGTQVDRHRESDQRQEQAVATAWV